MPLSQYTGILKTIDGNLLEKFTKEGWVVVDSFDEQIVVQGWGTAPRKIPQPMAPGYNAPPTETVETRTPLAVLKKQFVVQQRPESELARLNAELAEARQRHVTAETLAAQAEASKVALAEETSARRLELSQSQAQVGMLRRAQSEDCARLQHMERDLGKLKQALGDLRMREILGDAR